MRASTSAWPSGESLGKSAACGGWAGGAAGMAWAAGVASAVTGATDAAAEAMAARRANSRREIRLGLVELGLEVSSIRSPFVSYGEVRNCLQLVPRRLLKAGLRVNISRGRMRAKR